MRANTINEFGGPQVLTETELPEPSQAAEAPSRRLEAREVPGRFVLTV